ncbi:hypothetical protein COU80_02700 [Candidatus Peregrinibacteria bacterium CG10_big_fil_rev_8_21_14_0_10_55_24]|nr:MAG: hypothetical protein COU80_02700 [Candidatus Peregrinibacteria bacterium CG10_big_fil_rev_8_21_14_0_10_55_24]
MSRCTRCSAPVVVQPQEEAFLRHIELPNPTLCAACRMQGRFAFRNERRLYHRKCDLTGKQIISVYPPDSPYKVYDQHVWYTDRWDALQYGRDFDFSRPFFEQMDALMRDAPKISVFTSNNVNSDYTNGAQQDKNCYMIFVSDHDEDCYYSYGIDSCKDCLECLNCFECNLCIECIDCSNSYMLSYCEKTHNCSESYFLSDCKDCKSCFGCYGLRNKQHCIFNEQLTEEEYAKKLEELNTGSWRTIQSVKDIVTRKRREQQIHQHYDGNRNENVTGDHIVNCKNCIECYDSADLEDCGYLIFSFKSRDCYDGHVVVDNCELCYGTISTINQYNTQFTFVSFRSKDSMYLDHCQSCRDCFGCSALQKKQYCILNKQYSKEEYEVLRARIVEHMKSTGEWGKPFPPNLSPFGYNDTVAQEYFPLAKDEVLKRGWKWYEDSERNHFAYQGPTTEIPDDIKDVPDGIAENILTCERSGKPYKLIPQEVQQYRLHKLPVPRLCFDERHLERIRRRNPRKLWQRNCQKCQRAIMSTFAPDRPEIVYCDACYLKEVY